MKSTVTIKVMTPTLKLLYGCMDRHLFEQKQYKQDDRNSTANKQKMDGWLVGCTFELDWHFLQVSMSVGLYYVQRTWRDRAAWLARPWLHCHIVKCRQMDG